MRRVLPRVGTAHDGSGQDIMKSIFWTLLGCAGIFFGGPLAGEAEIHPCAAYDKLARRAGLPIVGERAQPQDPLGGKSINQMLTGVARGDVKPIRVQAPAAPPDPMIGLTCTTSYWKNVTGLARAT